FTPVSRALQQLRRFTVQARSSPQPGGSRSRTGPHSDLSVSLPRTRSSLPTGGSHGLAAPAGYLRFALDLRPRLTATGLALLTRPRLEADGSLISSGLDACHD